VATARGLFPATTAAEREAVMNRRTERHKTGPLGVVLYRPQGADPMDWMVLARGFGIEFVGALLLALLVWTHRLAAFPVRLGACLMAALFAIVATHPIQWNFLYFPMRTSSH
jgi:hypothetical protein